MEMSELHALNALHPEKEIPIHSRMESGPGREESLAPAGKEIQNFSVVHSCPSHYTDWAIQDSNIKIALKEVRSDDLDWIHVVQDMVQEVGSCEHGSELSEYCLD